MSNPTKLARRMALVAALTIVVSALVYGQAGTPSSYSPVVIQDAFEVINASKSSKPPAFCSTETLFASPI